MSQSANATFEGENGSYDFDVYNIDTEFNDIGAVYIFTKRVVDFNGKGKHTFIYIGQTDSLKDRIPNHEKLNCVIRNGGNCICIHRDDDKNSRIAKETDLRAGNNTPCNDQ